MTWIKFNLSLLLITLIFVLGACGSADPVTSLEAEIQPQDAEPAVEESDEMESFSLEDFDEYAGGTDLDGVQACELVSNAEVAAIVGPLREDETEEDISLAGEVGCQFHDQEGHFYTLTYYPISEWTIAELTLNNPEPVEGLLDGAWMGSYSGGEITVKALVEEEMVIGAHISVSDLELARELVELLAANRPQ
jgi:hypothetical protein